MRTSNRFPAGLLPEGKGASWFLIWDEGWGVSRGVASVAYPCLWWCCVPVACTVLCYCSWLLKWQLGFWPFLYLVVPNLPPLHMHAAILAPYIFFVFSSSRRCLSRCKHCSPGSYYLTSSFFSLTSNPTCQLVLKAPP